jgi:hypothetical protein
MDGSQRSPTARARAVWNSSGWTIWRISRGQRIRAAAAAVVAVVVALPVVVAVAVALPAVVAAAAARNDRVASAVVRAAAGEAAATATWSRT